VACCVFLLAALALLTPSADAVPQSAAKQSSGSQGSSTRRKVRVEEPAPAAVSAVDKAEEAIARKDYAAAEPLLRSATAEDPKDYRAWFDLGFVLSATGRRDLAISAYRNSIGAKADVFESNLNLGVLLGDAGDPDAETYLRAATTLRPTRNADEGHKRAWLALGHALEAQNVPAKTTQAVEAYRAAAQLAPRDPEPRIAAGIALERSRQWLPAEAEYKQALELDPANSEALAGLVNVYSQTKRFPEAEAMLRRYLEQQPANTTARVQLGRVLAAQGRSSEAAGELEAGLKAAPDDPVALRELAGIYVSARQYGKAEQAYRALVKRFPSDGDLHAALGNAIMQQKRFAEAQQELLTAVSLKPNDPGALVNLALTGSETKDYQLCIRALDARARTVPDGPGTFFLRATCYDHLRAYKQAAQYYHQFLDVSKGENPDQEFQARHRLIAIEPKK